ERANFLTRSADILRASSARHLCIAASDPGANVLQLQLPDDRMVCVKPGRWSFQKFTRNLQPALLHLFPSLGPGHDRPTDPVEGRRVRVPYACTGKTVS